MRSLLLLAPVALFAVACAADPAAPAAGSDDSEVVAAKLQGFDCTTDAKVDGDIQHLTFSVKNIDSASKIEVLDPTGKEDEDYSPIKVTPEEGRTSSLNENMGIALGSDRITISGDSDGFYLLDFVLFKDSGFSKGYLRIHHSEDGDAYSLVSCKVSPLAAPKSPTP